MKTYKRHCELIQDMLEHISPTYFVIFGKRKWNINGFKFKPILYNKRYEEKNYKFEADAMEIRQNILVYENCILDRFVVKKLSIKLNQNEKQ